MKSFDSRSLIFKSKVGAKYRHQRSSSAFTLVEILVAVFILTILMVFVVEIAQDALNIISTSHTHLSADAQAREVFSRFDLDLKGIPMRTDLDVVFSSSNNAIFFYSEASGFFDSSNTTTYGTLALVGYRVDTNAQLERLGKVLAWTNSLFLTYATNQPSTNSQALSSTTIPGAWGSVIGTPPIYNDGSDSDYHLLADGVFRIFYCFQKTDGTYALTLSSNAMQDKFQDASALILTLAVLDHNSRAMVNDITKLAAALPNPSQTDLDNGMLPAQLWQNAVNNIGQFSQSAAIPKSVVGRVRIYQRSFPLNTQ